MELLEVDRNKRKKLTLSLGNATAGRIQREDSYLHQLQHIMTQEGEKAQLDNVWGCRAFGFVH